MTATINTLNGLSPWPEPDGSSGPGPQPAGGYFAPEYFAPSYFAPTYFPGGAVIQTVNLGRFRMGDRVPIRVAASGVVPSIPYAVVLSGASAILTIPLANIGLSNTFSSSLFLGYPDFGVGTFKVQVAWKEGDLLRGVNYLFEVVPGGDHAGRLVSVFQSRSGDVIAQASSGELLQGSSPSTGV